MRHRYKIAGLPLLIFFAVNTTQDLRAATLSYIVVQNSTTPLHVNNVLNGVSTKQITISSFAKDIAIANDGLRVYVVSSPEDDSTTPVTPYESLIDVIDAERNTKLATIKQDADNNYYLGAYSQNIEISKDNKYLFADSDIGLHRLTLNNDRKSITAADRIDVPFRKLALDMSEDGSYLIATGSSAVDFTKTGISIVDPENFVLLDQMELGSSIQGVTTKPDGSEIYVASLTDDGIYVLTWSGSKLTQKKFISLTAQGAGKYCGPVDVAFEEEQPLLVGPRLYVSCSGFFTDPKQQADMSNIVGNDGGVITVKLNNDTDQVFFKPLVPADRYAPANFGGLHPGAISYDSKEERLYLIKNFWGQPTGTFVSTIVIDSISGINAGSEVDFEVMKNNNTYSVGRFVGPECKTCPSGVDTNSFASGFSRRTSIDYSTIGLLFALVVFRGMRRVRGE
jgi:hypothetical protein